MKRIYTLLLAIMLIIPASYAQKGLSLGVNGEYTGITIINQNTWDTGREYDYTFTNAGAFGFDVGYNFTDELGIYSGFGIMTLGQDYTDAYAVVAGGEESNWERTLRFNYHVVPLMFKFTGSENTVNFIGGFGILYAVMKEAEQTWTKDGEPWNNAEGAGNTNVTERFNKKDIILNIEFGARIFVMDNLYIDATMNLGYGLTDINDEAWRTPNKDGMYNASHNAYGGIKVGVAYVLFGE